jgi:hypothetical protein
VSNNEREALMNVSRELQSLLVTLEADPGTTIAYAQLPLAAALRDLDDALDTGERASGAQEASR